MGEVAAACERNLNTEEPSAPLRQTPSFQITVDFSASTFSIVFALVFAAFIAYLLWDFLPIKGACSCDRIPIESTLHRFFLL